jgi:hypothetical protein
MLVRGSRGSCWFDAARVACGAADVAVAAHSMRVHFFVEYLYYYVRWCASLQPPTIYAKSSSAYNA